MRFLAFISACLWAFSLPSTVAAAAQHTTFVELAPVPQWQPENSQTLSLDSVRRWGGVPEVDREYSVTSVELRIYRKADLTAQAIVEEAADPSTAYGLLTFYQNESMQQEKGMKLTVVAPDQACMARGKEFIRVLRPDQPKISDEGFRSLLISIGGPGPSASAMSLLPPPLPAAGQVTGSLKYVLGPVAAQRALPSFRADLVGFQQGAELQVATYRQENKQAQLFLISYPTPQIAKLRYRSIEHLLGVNQEKGPGSFYGQRKGTYVLLVQNATSRAMAGKLMDTLGISQVISWDEPYPNNKPITVQLYQLVIGTILLVLMLVGMAVGAGFLIFAFRRLTAKWFPQWTWASGYEDSIIRLNLK